MTIQPRGRLPDDTHDVVVVGGGSAGVRFARVAADLGARVALVHAQPLGGTCVNEGCIPKKLLSYGARLGYDLKHASAMGWTVGSELNWIDLRNAMVAEVMRLNHVYESLMHHAGVELFAGFGRLLGEGRVGIANDRVLKARTIVLATGAAPRRPVVVGVEHMLTSTDVFTLKRMPTSLVIVGGGYIALELASIFTGLGCPVTLVHRGERVLRGFDRDVVDQLTAALARQGVRFKLNATISSVEFSGSSLLTMLSDGRAMASDSVISAVGRIGATAGLGLERVGLCTDSGGLVQTAADGATAVAGLFAVGDVASTQQLTPMATRAGERLAQRLFGDMAAAPPPAHVFSTPTAVFTHPALGAVGKTEQQAIADGHVIDVYTSKFTPLRSRLSGDKGAAFIKLVVERRSQRVLGIHIVAEDAAEIIQGFAIAVHAGVTKPQFDATLGVHPTVAEELVTMRALSPRPAEAQ